MTTTKLPELPEPDFSLSQFLDGKCIAHAYTADQLRAYGDEREAYGRADAPAAVGDREIWQRRAYPMAPLMQKIANVISEMKAGPHLSQMERDSSDYEALIDEWKHELEQVYRAWNCQIPMKPEIAYEDLPAPLRDAT